MQAIGVFSPALDWGEASAPRNKFERAEEETVNSRRQLFTAEGEAEPVDKAIHRGLHIEKVDCRCDRLSVKVVCYGNRVFAVFVWCALVPLSFGVMPRQLRP